jgi:hypothetical protein
MEADQVAVLCVTVVSCAGIAPGRLPDQPRTVLVEATDANEAAATTAAAEGGALPAAAVAQRQQTAALPSGPAPALNSGGGEVLVFRATDSSWAPRRLRLLLMDTDVDLRDGPAGPEDRAQLPGCVGAAEIQLRHARMEGRWKLQQRVALLGAGGQPAGTCDVVLRWDPSSSGGGGGGGGGGGRQKPPPPERGEPRQEEQGQQEEEEEEGEEEQEQHEEQEEETEQEDQKEEGDHGSEDDEQGVVVEGWPPHGWVRK